MLILTQHLILIIIVIIKQESQMKSEDIFKVHKHSTWPVYLTRNAC